MTFPTHGRKSTLSFAQNTCHWVFAYLSVVVVLNLIIMDLDDGSLSSCSIMAAAIATTSVILDVKEEEEEEEERRSRKTQELKLP